MNSYSEQSQNIFQQNLENKLLSFMVNNKVNTINELIHPHRYGFRITELYCESPNLVWITKIMKNKKRNLTNV